MSDQRIAFQRFGRSHHLLIDGWRDLQHALSLDEALWVATSAPTNSLVADDALLGLLDVDGDGRVLARELKRAIAWALEHLADPIGLDARSGVLALSAVNPDAPDGPRMLSACRRMLARLGRGDAGEITLAQVRQIKVRVEANPVSETGVVLPEAAGDEDIRGFLSDILATVGGADHPGGRQGVGAPQLQSFLSEARGLLEWSVAGRLGEGGEPTAVMPLGERTGEAYAALEAVRDKVDQYFAQCRAVQLSPAAANRITADGGIGSVDFADPSAIDGFLERAPLAAPRPDRVLRFDEPVNPFYAGAVEALRERGLAPLLGGPVEAMSEAQWRGVLSQFQPHRAWLGQRRGQAVERLGRAKLEAYLDERFDRAVRELIAECSRTVVELDSIRLVEKLILYQRHLIDLANNFVSFPLLYEADSRAMFEMGTLVMDGRRFNMAVRVDDRAQHSLLAKTSSMYVLYVEVLPGGGEAKFEVAVPVTSGGQGNLVVGKRGVFQDVRGRELDARVVQVIENPISLAEALVAPFKRVGRILSGKVEAITTEAEKKLDVTASTAFEGVSPGQAQPPTPTPERRMMMGGLLMGGGVALAAMGSAVAYITRTFSNIENYFNLLVGLLLAVLAVMIPITIVAVMKLRRRDLSAILEGSGWAINARMRLTRRQCRFFTKAPPYPPGAKGVPRRRRLLRGVVIVLIVALAAGGVAAAVVHLRASAPVAEEAPPASGEAPEPANPA